MEAIVRHAHAPERADTSRVTKKNRLVLTGPESTGKTTLAAALADELDGVLVPEAARTYAEERRREGQPLTADDVEPIARRAIALEDEALASTPSLLVLDTDLLSTVVYARHYYGSCPGWIETAARERRGDLYLLMDIDLPWESDGVRDRPGTSERLHGLFAATLSEFGCEVVRVAGLGPSRLIAARAAAGRYPFLERRTAQD
jgi:NadR type nicotinamide-nucleotide adenylyltransferase